MIRNPECNLCPLSEGGAKTICLMPDKVKRRRVMFVGEAPGKKEDLKGIAFTGAPGRKLEDFIKKDAKLRLEECYITNAVKCRPIEADGTDGKPSAKEIKACRTYLEREIRKVKPEIIVPLGAVPLKTLVGNSKIKDYRGKAIPYKDNPDITIFPTNSPAACLFRASTENTIRADFKRLGFLLRNGTPKKPSLNLTIVDTKKKFERFLRDLAKAKYNSYDVETNSIEYWLPTGRLFCAGFALNTNKQFIIPLEIGGIEGVVQPFTIPEQQEMFERIREVIERLNIKVINHNIKFDNNWTMAKFGFRFFAYFDTMLASHILNENRLHGLKELIVSILNGPEYDLSKKDKLNPTKETLAKLYEYCAYDCYFTLKLYEVFREELREDQTLLELFKYMVMPLARLFEEIEYDGVYINPVRLRETKSKLRKRQQELLTLLDKVTKTKNVNWNSNDQVGEVFFNKLKLPVIKQTAKGKPSIGHAVLVALEKKHKVVKLLLEYKKITKQLNTFVEKWENLTVDNIMRPSYRLHGTVTGRPSCHDPNLQQTPRDGEVRSLVDAPPGWTLVAIDYSQLELRIAAMMANEPTMIRVFRNNGDIHTETAKAISPKPWDSLSKEEQKELRSNAKPVNFGFLYGMGHNKFVSYAKENYKVDVTEQQAKKFRNRYFELYSKLLKWHERQRSFVRAQGQIRDFFGWIRRLPDIYSSDPKTSSEAERQAINSPVQGLGARMCFMAMIALREKFSRKYIRQVGNIHDSVLLYIRNDKVKKFVPQIIKLAENPPLFKRFGFKPRVPILVDTEICVKGWGAEGNPKYEKWLKDQKKGKKKVA